MSQALALPESPERDVPLTEIPRELRRLRDEAEHYRQQAALEFTRAEALARQLRESERSAADWQLIALSNGEQLAHAQVDLARRELDVAGYKEAHEAWLARSQANFARADKLAQYIETLWEDEALTPETEHVRELIENAGVDCEKCGGDGTRWVDDGSDTRHPMVREDCDACHGVGAVLR